MTETRRIFNPVQKDYVTFLETSQETNGAYTLVEVELAPRGGVGLHYHKTYAETFTCIDGELSAQLAKKIQKLPAGTTATADANVNHRFFNAGDKPCRFRVMISPASRGFEQSLQVGYGLARDGETKSNGFPKDKLALAWLFSISESNLPGWMSMFEWILRAQAKKAVAKGIDRKLVEKYVRF